jgi:MFS transporter, FHS family, L-fucose permease
VAIAIVLVVVFAAIAYTKRPHLPSVSAKGDLGSTFKRLLANKNYTGEVIAQAFYVGAQIMCWTFIIHYAEIELGMDAATAQGYNIAAMIIFVSSRFTCTFLLWYLSPGRLLMNLAILGGSLMPPMQGAMIDMESIGTEIPATRLSFVLPLVCFVVVAHYGWKTLKRAQNA